MLSKEREEEEEGGGGLTNIYLQKTAYEILPNGSSFVGVFSCDQVCQKEHIRRVRARLKRGRGCVLISNLAPADELGTHFVAVCVHSRYVTYFDPLGLPSDCDVNIAKYLRALCVGGRQKRKLYEVIRAPIQHVMSAFCGLYCLAFVIHCCSNERARTPSSHFSFVTKNFHRGRNVASESLLENDKIVVTYITQAIDLARR